MMSLWLPPKTSVRLSTKIITVNLVLELKKLNIEIDMPPNKLKTGHGEGVCSVLQRLCEMSLTNKFKFKKPIIKDDSGAMDDEGDDMDDDIGGGADIADMVNNGNDDDDIEEDFGDFGGAGAISK